MQNNNPLIQEDIFGHSRVANSCSNRSIDHRLQTLFHPYSQVVPFIHLRIHIFNGLVVGYTIKV